MRRIDIVYVCSNADIAAQNIRKLNVTDSELRDTAESAHHQARRADSHSRPHREAGHVRRLHTGHVLSVRLGSWEPPRSAPCSTFSFAATSACNARRATAAQRIFQGFVASRRRFVDSYVAHALAQRFESSIRRTFLEEFDRSCERGSLLALVDEVMGRRALTADQHRAARRIVGSLRRDARASRRPGAGAGPRDPG